MPVFKGHPPGWKVPEFPSTDYVDKDKGDVMKIKRKIIEIDEERCDGCGKCILSCAEGALAIVDGKAKVGEERRR